jgi:hypothetical protein
MPGAIVAASLPMISKNFYKEFGDVLKKSKTIGDNAHNLTANN